jgi:L-arabinonolactonase
MRIEDIGSHAMKSEEVSVLGETRNIHGEGPVWSELLQKLFWTDIESRLLWEYDPRSSAFRSRPMTGKVCSFAFREQGGMLIAFDRGLSFYDLETQTEEYILDVEPDLPTTRLNDGRCDRQGRFIVGGFDSSEKGLSAAYRLDGDMSLHRLFGGLSSANSTCFSPDGTTMYYADTPQAAIWAFDYDIVTGTPSERREFCSFADQPGLPDGSVIDAEGYLWNAQWNGSRIARYRPDGTVDRVIETPCLNPTSLAFGGPDLDVLFITTSRLTLSADQVRAQPLAGALLSIKPGVRGMVETKFRG